MRIYRDEADYVVDRKRHKAVPSGNHGVEEGSLKVRRRDDCPYLHTVNRQILDFDGEKSCCSSLAKLNVYACLVCGKYFQGRGRNSVAYIHSLEAGHHVYINLKTEKVYCLPDGYEVLDPSLDDIRHVLNPRFTREQVEQLDSNQRWSRALDGNQYLPGMVGLNNLKHTDFVNVTIQSLMRVTPLRNFFLDPENYQQCKSQLVQTFGELTRKIWHARNFKRQVSPHEFLQAVTEASEKRFQQDARQSDPCEFMSWLLNTLDRDLQSLKAVGSSIVRECFQVELEVVEEINGDNISIETRKTSSLFMLGLDLPPVLLFKDENIIPQVPLFDVLKKFDGRYRVKKLPRYLILHYRRFTKNNFFDEKNPTIVNFPLKNMDLRDFIRLPATEQARSKFDLISNIVHEGEPGEGSYKVFVQRKSTNLWYEMLDHVVSETLPELVPLSEAYIQIYEQQQ